MTPFQALKHEADRVFSLWIRRRDGGRCVLCGSVDSVECGHLFPRHALSTRWDKTNAHALCHACNQRHEEHPEHYITWWKEKHGQEAYSRLLVKYNKPLHHSNSAVEAIIDEYRYGSNDVRRLAHPNLKKRYVRRGIEQRPKRKNRGMR